MRYNLTYKRLRGTIHGMYRIEIMQISITGSMLHSDIRVHARGYTRHAQIWRSCTHAYGTERSTTIRTRKRQRLISCMARQGSLLVLPLFLWCRCSSSPGPTRTMMRGALLCEPGSTSSAVPMLLLAKPACNDPCPHTASLFGWGMGRGERHNASPWDLCLSRAWGVWGIGAKPIIFRKLLKSPWSGQGPPDTAWGRFYVADENLWDLV